MHYYGALGVGSARTSTGGSVLPPASHHGQRGTRGIGSWAPGHGSTKGNFIELCSSIDINQVEIEFVCVELSVHVGKELSGLERAMILALLITLIARGWRGHWGGILA